MGYEINWGDEHYDTLGACSMETVEQCVKALASACIRHKRKLWAKCQKTGIHFTGEKAFIATYVKVEGVGAFDAQTETFLPCIIQQCQLDDVFQQTRTTYRVVESLQEIRIEPIPGSDNTMRPLVKEGNIISLADT